LRTESVAPVPAPAPAAAAQAVPLVHVTVTVPVASSGVAVRVEIVENATAVVLTVQLALTAALVAIDELAVPASAGAPMPSKTSAAPMILPGPILSIITSSFYTTARSRLQTPRR
jgi:hypothetical protein